MTETNRSDRIENRERENLVADLCRLTGLPREEIEDCALAFLREAIRAIQRGHFVVSLDETGLIKGAFAALAFATIHMSTTHSHTVN